MAIDKENVYFYFGNETDTILPTLFLGTKLSSPVKKWIIVKLLFLKKKHDAKLHLKNLFKSQFLWSSAPVSQVYLNIIDISLGLLTTMTFFFKVHYIYLILYKIC